MQDVSLNYGALKRKPRPYHPFTFQDSNIGEVKISLRRLLSPELDACDLRAAPLIAKYVTGGFENEFGTWCKDPILYSMIDGEFPPLNEVTIQKLVKIEAMQPPAVNERHGFHQLLTIMITGEEAWSAIYNAAARVMGGLLDREEEKGKDSTEPLETPPTS